eukprot:scaffold67788_cov48-Attheya_sp.AAC.1
MTFFFKSPPMGLYSRASSKDDFSLPESDKKQSATTRSKTQAFDLEALQLLVASNAQTATETTASLNDLGKKLATLETKNVGATDKKVSKIMKKIDINQAIQDDRQETTTKSIANLQTTLESQPVAITNNLRNDIDEL